MKSWGCLGVLGLALSAGQATADVASNIGYVSDVYLYYVDHQDLVRAYCPGSSPLHDRSSCATEPHRAPVSQVFAAVEADVGAKLQADQDMQRDLYVRIGQIDDRLLELLNATPSPTHPELLQQISAAEDHDATLKTNAVDLANQIASIETELTHQDDLDLRSQLAALRAQLNDTQNEMMTVEANIVDLRQQYIDDNAQLLDQATYQDLENERSQLVDQLGTNAADLRQILNQLVEASRLEKAIMDPTFVTDRLSSDSSGDQQAGANALQKDFDAIDLAQRTTNAVLTNSRYLLLHIAATTGIERFTCQVQLDPGLACDKLVLHSPAGVFYPLESTQDFEVRAADGYAYPTALKEILNGPATGTWEVDPGCDDLPEGQPWIESFTCYLTVKAN